MKVELSYQQVEELKKLLAAHESLTAHNTARGSVEILAMSHDGTPYWSRLTFNDEKPTVTLTISD